MKSKAISFVALLMAACLLVSGAFATSVLGLDEALSTYLDGNDDVRFSLGMQVQTLMPYGEATVEMLNGVLKHIDMNATLLYGDSGISTALALQANGQTVLDFSESVTDAGTQLQTSLLENRVLTSAASAMDQLSGNEAGNEAQFDFFTAVSDVQACYRELTNAIIPYAEEKKASYKIKDIGSSRWSRIARLTVEQSEELAPLMAQVLGSGMDAQYREWLNGLSYQKGFVVALYQAEQGGKDMAVYMKGTVTAPDGTACKLAYQWAFIDNGTERKDTYKFEMVRSKSPADNRVIAATYSQKQFSDRFQIDGNCQTTYKNAEGTVATTIKHDLSGADSAGVRDITGTITGTVKTTVSGDTQTVVTTLKPALLLTSAERSGVLSGTVELQETTAKKVTKALLFTFADEPAQALTLAADAGELYAVSDTPDPAEPTTAPTPTPVSSLLQNEDVIEAVPSTSDYLVGQNPIGLSTYTVPTSMQHVDLDTASDAQLEALLGELAQNMAGRLLIALSSIPDEDAGLLMDNMSEEDYAAFLSLVNGL